MSDFLTAIAVLRRNYLFRELSEAALISIASLAKRCSFEKGEVIFSQNDPGDALYGVASGRVRISSIDTEGNEVFLNIMEPGDTFGEIAVMDDLPRTAGATALEETRLIQIKRVDFLSLIQREPELSVHLLKLMCMRLRWISELVEDSAFLSGPARIAKRLLILASLHGRPINVGELELRISQSELAQFLGISRQIVNQHLREWQKYLWVDLGRERITVRNADALRNFIAQDNRNPKSA